MTRRYDIDAIRVIAFGILILYHCAMLYVPGWGWHIKSNYQIDNLDYVMRFFNAWRMPLIFLVSGTAIAMAKPHQWLSKFVRNRTYRLLFPLIIAMIFSVPLQAFVQASANGSWHGGLGEFLFHYFTFQPWPENAFDGSNVGFTWNHLWYLPYLFVYTMILVALISIVTLFQLKEVLLRALTSPALLITIVFIYMTLVKTYLQPLYKETHALWGDWYAHAWYLGYFLIGYLLGTSSLQKVWDCIKKFKLLALLIALNCYLVAQLIHAFVPSISTEFRLVYAGVNVQFTLTAILAILGYGYTYLNKKDSVFSKLSQAIFPWYIFHQTYIIVLAYWLIPLQLGVVTEFATVVAGTAISCWITYKLVMSKLTVLKPAIGVFK